MREEPAHVKLGLRHVTTGEPARTGEKPQQGDDGWQKSHYRDARHRHPGAGSAGEPHVLTLVRTPDN